MAAGATARMERPSTLQTGPIRSRTNWAVRGLRRDEERLGGTTILHATVAKCPASASAARRPHRPSTSPPWRQRAACATRGLARIRTWTLLTFAVIIPILWLLPGLLYLATRRIASACHATRAAAAPPEAPHKIGDESSAPVGPRSLRRRSSEMASAARLVAAEKADRALRARVSGTAFYVGYILLVLGWTPFTIQILGIDLTATAGSFVFYATGVPWGTMMLALALRPIDAIYIRRTNIFLGCVCAGGATVMAFVAFNPALNGGGNPIIIAAFWSIVLVLLFATAVVWSTLGVCRKSGERMPPRRQLRRLWLTLRFVFFALAAIVMAMFFAPLYHQASHRTKMATRRRAVGQPVVRRQLLRRRPRLHTHQPRPGPPLARIARPQERSQGS